MSSKGFKDNQESTLWVHKFSEIKIVLFSENISHWLLFKIHIHVHVHHAHLPHNLWSSKKYLMLRKRKHLLTEQCWADDQKLWCFVSLAGVGAFIEEMLTILNIRQSPDLSKVIVEEIWENKKARTSNRPLL